METISEKIKRIQAEVCSYYGVSLTQLLSQGRTKTLAQARQELYLRLRSETKMSVTEIGTLCNRHHSTILYGVKRARERGDPGS